MSLLEMMLGAAALITLLNLVLVLWIWRMHRHDAMPPESAPVPEWPREARAQAPLDEMLDQGVPQRPMWPFEPRLRVESDSLWPITVPTEPAPLDGKRSA